MEPIVTQFGALQRLIQQCASRRALNEDPAYRARLGEALDAVPLAAGDVLSLDIFDTLLLRCDRSELRRFWEIGEAMAAAAGDTHPVSPVDAFLLRQLGVAATYRASAPVDGCREGCLSEAHHVASLLHTGGDILHDAFVEAEIAYEATTLTPSALLHEVERHRQRGGAVILVTDMYMRESHVRRLLERVGVPADLFAHIFSSADHKVSKASGGIFGAIERAMARPASDFLHVGDSLNGDFRRPIAHGWRALHLPIADAERRRRRNDHLRLRGCLRAEYGLVPNVPLPQ